MLLVLARKERDLLEIKFEVETEAFCKNQAITIVDSELFMTQHTQEPISMINCEEKNPTEENSAQCLPLLLDDLFSPSMVDDFFHEIEDVGGTGEIEQSTLDFPCSSTFGMEDKWPI